MMATPWAIIEYIFNWYSRIIMVSNMESLNIIEPFSNLYVSLDCSEQDYVGFEIPVCIAKKY